ncbi:MAG: hypothetical protein A2Y89_06710 [Chloroflexi bacterium RBG_13_51_18]|nr:MAG: hypothetical protein A2Y89_06710 [Chloroflexi bacterium RBG_13_51_18]
MADGSQEKPYRVLKIDELVRVSDTGGVERYYRHQIRTRAGVVLSVDVLERDWTAKTAPAILLARAVEADKIFASQG